VFVPKANQAYRGSTELKSKVVFSILEDVKSKLLYTEFQNGKWTEPKALDLSGTGNISLASSTDEADLFMYTYENFNQPTTLYSYEFGKQPQKLKALPSYFDATGVKVEQKFATSKDGTKVPYFLVYKEGTKFDGTAPTLQYGYGGFLISQTAGYSALVGKLWLERGGVYAVANIRGGAEYGPKWHEAALKENRQKAYDDFIAVSEDLIATKVTSPKHLAIRGGSNGGLLVGVAMTERPDLYGAVLCQVPLLDMIRYSQLLAGASWMGEYGDPKIPRYRRAILKYSPYQNVSAEKQYPPVLFVTSTKDDRVHPGHARKMAHKMKDQKHQVLYYENTEGGHAATANLKQQARLNALQYSFLLQTISKK
jgi:prolyl oligopeptidase